MMDLSFRSESIESMESSDRITDIGHLSSAVTDACSQVHNS